ncbi:MAG: NAD(P)H-quinone oxidoreductase [Hyphomonadaceae bacterium]|nr:NAD(P)H-quinone oxidoreductase [Hyphomonadaceae bacterium]
MGETMWAVVVEDDQPLKLGDVTRPECGPDDVLIEVQTAGLNRADLVQRRGLYPPPPGASEIMGLECAGTIVETGANVTGWGVGDRVCGLMAGGGYAEYALVDQGSLFRIPDGMSFNEAGALPEVMMTVWANIFDRCQFKPGESVLIHGGTSGIGTMAIQMLKVAGAARIMITAGSDEKCAYAKQLGADIAINYKTADFEAIVRDEGGADIILDMVGGDYVQKNISAAKLGGRIVNIAYMQGSQVQVNLMPLMLKRLILTGTTLRARPNADKQRIRDAILADFWPAVLSGAIKPIIDTVYPFDQAEAAQAHMAKGGHIGKILLSRQQS